VGVDHRQRLVKQDRVDILAHHAAAKADLLFGVGGQAAGLAIKDGLHPDHCGDLADAGLDAADVQLIEAHGTGTALGDPIETGALAAVFGAGRSSDEPLYVTSVKANVGHLEPAAGMAGLLAAIAEAARLAKISGKPQVVVPDFPKRRLLDLLMGSGAGEDGSSEESRSPLKRLVGQLGREFGLGATGAGLRSLELPPGMYWLWEGAR
jgi:hypothetical protein